MMGSPENRGRICYVKADRAKRLMHVLNLMTKLAQPDDIILANIGIHYNDMSELSEDMPLIGSALKQPGLSKNVFWIETSPQHFGSPTGKLSIRFTQKFLFLKSTEGIRSFINLGNRRDIANSIQSIYKISADTFCLLI